MEKQKAKKRIEELRKKAEYHANLYYNEDKPEISDFEYDMMMLELRALESQFPELITLNSTGIASLLIPGTTIPFGTAPVYLG